MVRPDMPNLLKLRRKMIGRKQMEIAEKIGYKNKSFISLMENAEVQMPLQKIADIAHAYEFRFPGDFMKLAVCFLHPETFAIHKSLLIHGYGFSESYIMADLEKAKLTVLIDCGIDPREGKYIDGPRKVMLTILELQRSGYQRLRLVS